MFRTTGAPQTLLKERDRAFVNKCFLQPVMAGCLGCFCTTGFSWHRYQCGNTCNLQIQSPRNTLWNQWFFLIIGVFSLLTCHMLSFWHLWYLFAIIAPSRQFCKTRNAVSWSFLSHEETAWLPMEGTPWQVRGKKHKRGT